MKSSNLDWRLPLLVVLCGVLWGAVNQLIPPLARAVGLVFSFDLWVWLGWPVAMLAVLLLLARGRSPLVWGVLGALFAGGVVFGWFGCYVTLFELGLTPQPGPVPGGIEFVHAWITYTASLVLRLRLVLAVVGGLVLGMAAGVAGRRVWRTA